MAYQTTNPYTGEILKTFPDATDAQVAQALERGHTAFQQWRLKPVSERVTFLQKAADLLRARRTEYAKLLTTEMGKLLAEAEAEVELSAYPRPSWSTSRWASSWPSNPGTSRTTRLPASWRRSWQRATSSS